MSKWYFPYGMDLEKESVNNARIETFRDNILESLARETCQNSLDVPVNRDKPIIMEFSEKEIGLEEIPDSESFINEIIPKAKTTWENDSQAQEFLSDYKKILKRDKIRVLRISDYNTSGLKDRNWESLIENAGTCFKDNEGSAGSFGIGKAAPFASSELRMVFYSTKLENGDEKSIGVTKFISFDNEDGTTAQGVGYLGKDKKMPIDKQLSFGFEERNTNGTDIYIIGFNQGKNWSDAIVTSLLENFLVSIYQEKIVIKVGDTIINKSTMGNLIKNLTDKKHDEIKNYYSILEDENMKTFYLDSRFNKYGFKEKDGVLFLSKGENANRSVLMTRNAGMKILDRKGISGSIQFNGIFQASGSLFNEMLRKMENPNHNDWIAERYVEDPKMAKSLLLDIYRFMKEKILESYEEKIEDQVDAFGISDFLPNNINNNEKEKKKETLENKVNIIEFKTRENKQGQVKTSNEGKIKRALVKSGVIEGDEGGAGASKNTETKVSGGEGQDGVGEPGGKNKEDKSGEKRMLNKNKKFKETKHINSRIFEQDYKRGRYMLAFNATKEIEKVKLELKLVGDNGIGYKPEILNAMINKEKLNYSSDSIIIENISKNEFYTIKFDIPYKDRMKMDVKPYEYK